MRYLRRVFFTALAGVFVLKAAAAIQVPVAGVTNDFTAVPAGIGEWSTLLLSGAAGTITDITQLDSLVQTIDGESSTNVPVPASETTGAQITAAWNSGLLFTRPTTVTGNALIAKVQNASGSTQTTLLVKYDLAMHNNVIEELTGHTVYYSATGAPNSWTRIGQYDVVGTINFAVNFAAWTNGAMVYLMWLDDNGSGTPDTLETIDNVVFGFPLADAPPQIVTPMTSQTNNAGTTATFTVGASGTPPLTYYWFTNNSFAASNGSGSFSSGPLVVGSNFLCTVIVSNALGTATNSATAWGAMPIPTISLSSPANGQQFISPATVSVSANPNAGNGAAVTAVGFYTTNSGWVATVVNSPFTTTLNNLAGGTYGIYAVVTNNYGAVAYSAINVITVQNATVGWVAYNDHEPGPATAPNVTTYTITPTTGAGGLLKDFSSGASLSARVEIAGSGTIVGTVGSSADPYAGTPAYDLFNGKVDFISSAVYFGPNPYSASVTLTFTNLTLGKQYSFRGTAVRGNAYVGRWTLVTLAGATSAVPAHQTGPGSPGIITNGWAPYGNNLVAATQAAFNSGENRYGDVIGWDSIVPNGDSFSVICSNYHSLLASGATVPGGTIEDTYCYAINAFRLEEFTADSPPVITAPLQNQTNVVGFGATFALGATGTDPLIYYWFTNGILAQTGSSSSFTSAPLVLGSNFLCTVVVSNAFGTAASSASAWGIPSSFWTAFNDHNAGPLTGPNVTTYNLRTSGSGGPLINQAGGATLPVSLLVSSLGNPIQVQYGGQPNVGTPAYNIFNGYVDFFTPPPPTPDNGSLVYANQGQSITLTFTNLDVTKRYGFRGTSIRAGSGSDFPQRWTLCLLAGAAAFTAAHSTGCVTAASLPASGLPANAAAYNGGMNVTNGDVVGWDNIIPSAAGTFSVVSTQYVGAIWGGTNANVANPGYAINGFRLTQSPGGPLVSLTGPTNSAAYTAPASIPLGVAVSDNVGVITNVSYYFNGYLIGGSAASPYTFNWNNVQFGIYTLIAVAKDNAGLSATSAPVNIVVYDPTRPLNDNFTNRTILTGVSFVTNGTTTGATKETGEPTDFAGRPSSHSIWYTWTAPISGWVRVTVTSTDIYTAFSVFTGNNVANLSLVTDATLGTSTATAAFSVVAGTAYHIGEDSQFGATGRTITFINMSNYPPVVALASPVSGSTSTAPASVSISANATAFNSITRVAFYAGANYLGEVLNAPYNFTWNGAPAGNYTLTAVATDSAGLNATSAPVNITVTQPPTTAYLVYSGGTYTETFDGMGPTGTTTPAGWFVGPAAGAQGAITSIGVVAGDGSTSLVTNWNLGQSGSTDRALGSQAGSAAGGDQNMEVRILNNTSSNIASFAITYDGEQWRANGVQEFPQYLVMYYSTNGINFSPMPASFMFTSRDDVNLSALNGNLAANRTAGLGGVYTPANPIPSSTIFYLRWYDTNNAGSDHQLAIDNVSFSVVSYATIQLACSLTSPANNAVYPAPALVPLAVVTSGAPAATNVDYYANGALIGASASTPFGLTWTNPPLGNYALVAVATGDGGILATSPAVNVAIISNGPPTVSITSPTPGAGFLAPANILLSASASDDYGIASVAFYDGGKKLDETSINPYQYAWSGVSAGNHALVAIATDIYGLAATSAVVNITVTNNAPPLVSLTNPVNNTTFNAPTNILLAATANDGDGAVTRVEFYLNGNKLGESTTAPYSLMWSNVILSGVYSLYAVATDNAGARATSAVVNVTVNGLTPPTVAITNPVNNTTFTAPATISISATASDSDGTVTNVAFYAGGLLLGQMTAVPYNLSWSNVNAGNYALTAVAIDNSGLRTTSAPVNITVSAQAGIPLGLTYTFTTAPPVTDWASLSLAGAGSTFAAANQLDAGVAATTAASVNQAVSAAGSYANRATAGWNSTAQALFTAPTGNGATLLMASVVNNMPGPVAMIKVTCNLSSSAITAEEINGLRAYYSLTGTANSWTLIPELSTNLTGTLTATVNVGSWASGSLLYILWADDNGNGSTDGAWILTSFLAEVARSEVVAITSPANNALIALPSSIPINAFVSGFTNAVTNVEFYANGAPLGNKTSAPYTFTWTNGTPGQYYLTAVATDNTGQAITSPQVRVTLQNNQPPSVVITSPADSTTLTSPANFPIAVQASDSDGTVANVQFFANGAKLGESSLTPYNFSWQNVPIGSYNLTAIATDNLGATSTASVIRVYVIVSTAPTVDYFVPGPGLVSNLTQITVYFNMPVDGVKTSDLLINGAPATSMSGTNGVYTFFFPQPPQGNVSVTWASPLSIYNREQPPRPFSGQSAGETAQYTMIDTLPPAVASVTPQLGTTVRSLSEIKVTFTESVQGVQASSLLVNGQPASAVAGIGAGPYTFSFATPPTGAVSVAWASGQTISDFATNRFVGQPWSYFFDPNAAYAGEVVINEIMFSPASLRTNDEWLEIHNTTAAPINLTGWQFTKGVDFTFPSVVLPANGYLVIAGDTNAFRAAHPSVNNVLGNWDGQLGNNGETIELRTSWGDRVDSLSYATEGDWAIRRRGSITYSGGFRGWEWYNKADALGSSLELINPALRTDCGQNWIASTATGGTPGTANSAAAVNSAPLLMDVQHAPIIPSSADSIRVTAKALDELTNGVTVTLYWRNVSSTTVGGPFNSVSMNDSGTSGDTMAGDQVFTGFIPPQANLTIIDFYVEARDSANNVRTWPAPAYDGTTLLGQVANALFQVDNASTPYDQPQYRLIMSGAERQELGSIWNTGGRINAEMNTTFIVLDTTETQVRYLCGVRNRGNSSRTTGSNPADMHNYRVNIPTDTLWRGQHGFSLNCKYAHSQYLGSSLFRKAGLPGENGSIVRLRYNGVDLINLIGASTVNGSNNQPFPFYIHLEELNSDWAANHFPLDPAGDLYRCMRVADLTYLGTNGTAYVTGGYDYSKQSNVKQNDWRSLANLTYVIANSPNSNWFANVSQVLNMDEWAKHIAAMSLTGFGETAIGSDGAPDDFTVYIGINDRRTQIMAHDHDTDFGEGDGSRQLPNNSIWRAAGGVAFINKLMSQPEFIPLYYGALKQYADTIFSTNEIFATYDQLLGPLGVPSTVTRMKNWSAQRVASVQSQINLALTVNNLGSYTVNNGAYVTTSASLSLSGLGNVVDTRRVLANGVPASWTPRGGAWSASVALNPGYNLVRVETVNSNGAAFASTNLVFYYDRGGSTAVSGNVAADTTWLVASGPYNVTGSLTIASGATLTIQPGTTVTLGSGVNITVANGGRLLAEGTAASPIRFTRAGTSGTWGGITVNGGAGSPETRIAYAQIEFNGSTAIHANSGTLFLDHLTFGNTAAQYVSLDGASFVVQDCVFPTTTGSFEGVHGTSGIKSGGRGIFLRNFFGAANGYNDVVDFTGGNRNLGQPIVQFINNVFIGSGDDLLDLDGTDAWIEGNIFLHTHKNGSPDSSSAISGGLTGSDRSDITIIGNLIYDCDQAANAKEGNFYSLINNTIVRITKTGGTDTNSSVVLMADVGTAEGAGMYLEGNIIYDAEKLVSGQTSSLVTYTNNIIYALAGAPWTGPGGNNINADPLFKRLPTLAETTNFTSWAQAQVLWDWFSLQPGSPAAGKGPNGRDLGAVVKRGASLAGEPLGPTPINVATLTVGVNRTGSGIPTAGFPNGSGFTHYKWRLDGGAWSAETPISTLITLNNLANGQHYVEVSSKNDAGLYQDDAVLGADAAVTRSHAWIVSPNVLTLRLNEVLASNRRAFAHYETSPDAVELLNFGSTTMDLSGVRLTDDPANPDKFVFPAGSAIGAGEYLVLLANNNDGTPGYHLGFNLRREGQTLYLYDSAARGNALLDSVAYGPQITDYSIGRLANGQWALNKPTLGAPNVEQVLGTPDGLKINEWLAAGEFNFFTDFVELFNTQTLPVALSGLYLTDKPDGWPAQDQLMPLSYIGPYGYTVFLASGQPENGPDNLNFRLSADHGVIELLDSNLRGIDMVFYDYLRPDYSVGRSPNGSATIATFSQPTPGAGNPSSLSTGTNVTVLTTNLLPLTAVWRYNDGGVSLDATGWLDNGYNDAGWSNGPALLEATSASTALPVATTMQAPNTTRITYYFRTTFNFQGSLAGASLVASYYLDDGAVIYLNGQEWTRINMSPTGPITYDSPAAISIGGDSPLTTGYIMPTPTNWVQGTNYLAVEVHQYTPSSSDITWAFGLDLVRSVTNIVGGSVVINEVFANGDSYTNLSGAASDWVELYNPGDVTINLAGMGLTDNSADPLRWVFPAGAQLAGHSFLVVACDGGLPASTNLAGLLNTGFALKGNGGSVSLYDPSSALVNTVNYGIQIADYSIGRSPDGIGAFMLTTPTPGSANIASLLGSAANLKINEWMPNDNNGGNDWFEIYNPGFLPVALEGLFLTDDLLSPAKSPLSPLSFISGGTNGYLKFIADNNPAGGANHVRFKLDNLKESIGLGTSNGFIDTIGWNYAVSQPGVSEGRVPDGSANVVTFPASASPEESNYLPLTNMVITEVLSASDLPYEDAIELQNITDQPVNVGGWYLSDAKNTLKKYRIPDNTIIAPHQFAMFYENQFNADPTFNPLAFSLSSVKGDEVYLASATNGVLTGYRTSVSFGPAWPNVSLGQYLTSDGRAEFVALSRMTFGLTNDPTSVTDFRLGAGASNAYPQVGPVVISEIMYRPPDLPGAVDNVRDEFVELFNITANTVLLFDLANPTNTWHLRGGVDFDFPPNVALPPGGYLLLVSFDPVLDTNALAGFRTAYPQLPANAALYGPYTGKLNNNGDSVDLKQPGQPVAGDAPYILVEHVKYNQVAPWDTQADGTGNSLRRLNPLLYGNDPGNWVASAPSPGGAYNPNGDSDGDGIPDAWVQQYFGHPSGLVGDQSRASDDPDNDSMSNLQEYLAGTSPNDPSSSLRILSMTQPSGGTNAPITFLAVSNHSYTVEFKTVLDTNVWSTLQIYPQTETNRLIQLSVPANGVSGFLRVRTP